MTPERWLDLLPPAARSIVRQAPPAWTPPMLGTLVRAPPSGTWVCERKLDGHRAIIVRQQGRPAAMHSRNGGDITTRHAGLLEDLPDRDMVLDGELVAMHDGNEDFGAVQRGRATHFVAFDVLNLDGRDVRALALRDRRTVLQALRLRGTLAVVASVEDEPGRLFARACEEGWEGIMAKDPAAPYTGGRSRSWQKLKCQHVDTFQVLGYTTGDQGIAALHLGQQADGRTRYAGKVGAGFSHAEATRLQRLFVSRAVERAPVPDAPPGAWVRPGLACRVAFTEKTVSGLLRHPRYLGMVDPEQALP